MPTKWKLYRATCITQMILAAFILFSSLPGFFTNPGFSTITRLLTFLLVMTLAIFAVNILNNNYPHTPIAGRQKSTFNKMFLLNFIFLAFLFGFVFAETRAISSLAILTGRPFYRLPLMYLVIAAGYTVTLAFQFIVLYGLYVLRRLLYANFVKQEFEFEK